MQVETRLSDQLARYLDLASEEAKITASNMANIDTPGYKALGFDFAKEIRSALSSVDAGNTFPGVQLQPVDGLVARPDGNNVSADREGLNMAEAQLKFKTGTALLRLEYQQVVDAIHADSK